MKTLPILLLAGTCSQIIDIEGCGKREIKYPCPEISPSPEVSPSIPPASPSPISSPSPITSPTPDPSPSPVASPSPIIPSPISSPSPIVDPHLAESGNYPLPGDWQKGNTCNAWYIKGTPTSLGTQYLSSVPIKPQGRYIGIRVNVSATPHVKKPYCEHSCYDENGTYSLSFCRSSCEQLKGCQDQDGTPIYITLPGKFQDEICDEQSHNKWNCHHKPEIGQTGPTTFIPYPRGVVPGSPEAAKFCGGPHPKRPGFVNCAGITVEIK